MDKKYEALKLALEALEQHGCPWIRHEKPYNEAITAIREALEQPDHEPVAVTRMEDEYIKIDYLADPFPVGPLYVAPLQPAQQHDYWQEEARRYAQNADFWRGKYESATAQQEPVALPEKMYEFVPTPEPSKWHHPECEGQCIACLIEQVVQEAYGSQGLGYLQRHLTSPPQRKPLTDEQAHQTLLDMGKHIETFGDESITEQQLSAECIRFIFERVAAHGIKENRND